MLSAALALMPAFSVKAQTETALNDATSSSATEVNRFPTFGLQIDLEPGIWSIDTAPALSGFVGRWTRAHATGDDFTQFSIRVLPGAGADAGPEVLAAVAERYTARDYTVTPMQIDGHEALRLDKPDSNTNSASAGPLLLSSHGGRVYEIMFLMPELDEAAVASVTSGWQWLPILPVASWVELSPPITLFDGRAQLSLPASSRQDLAPIEGLTGNQTPPEDIEIDPAEGDPLPDAEFNDASPTRPPAEPIRFVAWDYVSREAVLTLTLEPREAPGLSLDLAATDYAHRIRQSLEPTPESRTNAEGDNRESFALEPLIDQPGVYASTFQNTQLILPDGRLATRSTRYLAWEPEPGFFVYMQLMINDDVTPGSVAQANCRQIMDQVVASIRATTTEEPNDLVGRSN